MRNYIIYLFTAAISIASLAACNSSKNLTTSKIGQTPVLMTEDDMKEILGPGYFQDSIIKKIHLYNTSDVTWRSESQENKVFIDFADGKVQSVKDKTKEMTSGFLPAGTEGQVDSVSRYNTGNIWKLKVKYILKQTGRAIYIWYYRKDKEIDLDATLDGPTHWFQSNNNADQVIDGVSLKRTTLGNKLQWMFSTETKQKTNKKGFDVVSPFASTTADPAAKDLRQPAKAEEIEEKN